MDSATVACGLAERNGALPSLGILLDGDTRQPQLRRRAAIVERLGLRDRTAEIADHLPSLDLRPVPGRRLGFNQEYYLEACATLWDQAVALGCDRLYTGIGGDELFPDYLHELPDAGEALEVQRERAHREAVDALLTARAKLRAACTASARRPARCRRPRSRPRPAAPPTSPGADCGPSIR
jgi:asparagine synthase (glutamine-hydrolysing)